MKILAGYENQNKTDYRAKAAEEVSRVQEKAKLLEERLQGLKPGDELTEGDVFEVCYQAALIFTTTDKSVRTLPMRCKAHNPRYNGCVKKSPTTMKRSRSYLK